MTEQELKSYIASIAPVDRRVMDAARKRQAELAKPPGSLGKLEDMAVRLAGLTGAVCPRVEHCRVAVFAGDNGVVAEGVSCAPITVTAQQCINMTRGKTGMSAMAAAFGDQVEVVDVGVATPLPYEHILNCRIAPGTKNLRQERAMTRQQVLEAVAVGIQAAERAKRAGVDALGIGEMGIGNTTTSSAVLAALTGRSAREVTGRGGGLTDDGFALKKKVIEEALALHRPDPADVPDVLSAVGGFDLAAMTGAYLGCARLRLPAVADGLISVVAALCAVRLCGAVKDALFLSHSSYEVGYQIAVKELGLTPCLDMDMRLGEGSGCVLLFRILQAACAMTAGMATFAQASIEDGYLDEIRAHDSFTVEKT